MGYRMWNDPLSLEETAHRWIARCLMTLPASLQVRLSGKPPVRHEQELLHPELQLILALNEKSGKPSITSGPTVVARQRMRRELFVFAGRPIKVGFTEDISLKLP